MTDSVITQVVEKMSHLPNHLQVKILEYVENLQVSNTRGIPGRQLLRFAGTIPIEELDLMEKAVESDCERLCLWRDVPIPPCR